ncbi:transcriptional repressor [Marinospirillum alkaliphilum]|uniref:Ferric uptake regulation protein n=1 Tax=Marinospirillum alkaliphilum DSM 21637 TaxID=1122209 RepID=A0A1K1XMS5_9GAMM|nr:transcriptional repressor [Marinospirillum alkaliphilum]SFX50838.1 Fur family transcriptional regulator, zinc uptake regulator [Marinospirillum alkaliphilum DSM 21637]
MSLEHEKLMAEADTLCLRKGLRLTPTRRRVLELIVHSPGGAKAYDLLDALTAENPSARPPTIYRAIDFLLSNGLIHRIESLNAYVSCACPEHAQAYQLLICKDCGKVQELHEESLDHQLDAAAARQGFYVEKKTIEVHGLCQQCHVTQHPTSH